MTPSAPSSDLPTHPFPSAASFTQFLDEHHTTLPGIYLLLAKKASGIPSITGAEAVECALCYGWIDGRANSVDDRYYTVRFTPRRKASMWSKKNVQAVERLISEGRMREEGLKRVNEAKMDGRWERAYSGPKEMTIPKDFEVLLEKKGNEQAKITWEGLGKSERYSLLHRVETCSVKARPGVVQRMVGLLREGKTAEKAEEKSGKDRVEKTVKTVKKKKDVLAKGKETSTKTKKVQRNAVEKTTTPRREGLRARG